jgi:hypothetical protein
MHCSQQNIGLICMTRRILITILVVLLVVLAVIVVAAFVVNDATLQKIAYAAQIAQGVAALALLVIARDIREAIKTRHLEGIKYVRGLLGSEDASERRRWIYQDLRRADWPLSSEDEKKALAVCRDFDNIGFLCRKGLIPVDLVVETYNRNIVDMWNRLERFVTQWRQQRSDEDYFWEFEWLAQKAEVVKRQQDGRRHRSP